jgi:chaperonin cofactor prefoldin
MSIFENISKRVSETAKAAAKKSGDIVEVTRLSVGINAEEDKIKKVYTDIGKILYQMYKSGQKVSDDLKPHCEKVDSYEKNIEEMKQKILQLRNVKLCPTCETELEMDMAYCFRCGEKQEIPEPDEEKCEEDSCGEGKCEEGKCEEDKCEEETCEDE